MFINAVVLQEAKDSSEIENIITTQDELYKTLTTKAEQNEQVKEVINYRKAICLLVIVGVSTYPNKVQTKYQDYNAYEDLTGDIHETDMIYFIAITLLLTAQLVFIVNVLGALIQIKKKK